MTGAELREVRLGLGMSQAELAEAIGLRTQSHISLMETGKKAVSTRTAVNVRVLAGLHEVTAG